ncbi:MAG: ATP-binding protein [Gemmatimonadota bacterium]|nr:ATP-binding protein [Gemmatimonadota bacterium]
MKLATRYYVLLAVSLVAAFVVLQDIGARTIRRSGETETARILEQGALMTSRLLADRPFDDPLADSLGAAQGLRVTLIGPDGTVLGDSEVPATRLPSVENHGGRPEVRAALDGSPGTASRASETIAQRQVYAAVPSPNGALRLSARLEGVESAVVRMRQMMLVALFIGLILGYPATHLVTRRTAGRLDAVQATVSGLAAGDFTGRTRLPGGDRVAALGQAVDRLADTLEERVGRSDEHTGDLRTMFDSLDDGVAFVNPEGLLQIRNSAFERWAGRGLERGARMSAVFRSPEILSAVETAQQGTSTTEEIRLGERTLLMSARPHRGGALLILRDLTNLRRLEGVRRDFVANVSHELKTPLTSIVGFAEAISGGELPAETADDFATRILANATRMRRLVDDLLDLSLIESGSWSPSLEPVPIGRFAHEVWDELSSGPEVRDVELDVDDPDVSVVQADARAVRQILQNLVGNALRYAPADSAIAIRVRPAGAFVRTEVIDAGPGIPSAHLGRVFERFYRVDPGRSREEGGTGLGLAIVKHLVVAHGGDVGIESEVSRGTTAWFTLPVSSESLAHSTSVT